MISRIGVQCRQRHTLKQATTRQNANLISSEPPLCRESWALANRNPDLHGEEFISLKVFISYSRNDEASVRSLRDDLRRAHVDTWLDEELRGGEAWWIAILEQIRACTVFVFALSGNSLYSKPCRTELDYAQALGLPILPVQIGEVPSYRVDPIFTVQLIDYRKSTSATGFALMSALHQRAAQRTDLPDPMPEPPHMPYEYLQRLGALIHSSAELPSSVQAQIALELRNARGEEHDATVLADIGNLLHVLRRRRDVTYAIASEIDSILRDDPTDAPVPPTSVSEPKPKQPLTSGFGQSPHLTPGTLIAIAAIAGVIPPVVHLASNYAAPSQIWFSLTLSLLLIAASFSIMAVRAKSRSDKPTMVSGWLMVATMLLRALTNIVFRGLSYEVREFVVSVHPILMAASSLLGVVFGVTVNRSKRTGWASILIIWGLCGVALVITNYIQRQALYSPSYPLSYFVLIVQMIVLLVLGILMHRESRQGCGAVD